MSTASNGTKRPGPARGSDNAKRGGQAVRDKYGIDFYRAMGKKGGDTTAATRGADFYAEIGRAGGNQTKARMGNEFYSVIGRSGGRAGRGADKRRKVKQDGGTSEASHNRNAEA